MLRYRLGMRKIRLDFSDFWPGFRKDDNFLWHLLNGLVVYLVMRIWVLHIAKDSDQHPRP